jgi:hypothetical protein
MSFTKTKEGKAEVVVFEGIKYRRYPEAKQWSHRMYYRPGIANVRAGYKHLHQDIWRRAHGEIPAGHNIHHKDGNPLNNSVENLELVKTKEHALAHSKARVAANLAEFRKKIIEPKTAAQSKSATKAQR